MHKTIDELQTPGERKVDVIRKALEAAKARKDHPDQPAIFSAEQCELFYKHANRLPEFMENEDARDLIMVFVDAFMAFVEPVAAPVEVEQVADPKK